MKIDEEKEAKADLYRKYEDEDDTK